MLITRAVFREKKINTGISVLWSKKSPITFRMHVFTTNYVICLQREVNIVSLQDKIFARKGPISGYHFRLELVPEDSQKKNINRGFMVKIFTCLMPFTSPNKAVSKH